MMGVMSYYCPATGKLVTTGVYTDERSMSKMRGKTLSAFCSHCQGEHHLPWSAFFIAQKAA